MSQPSAIFQSGDILFIPVSSSTIFAFSLFSKKNFTVSKIPEYARKLDSVDIKDLHELSEELRACLLKKYSECCVRYDG